MPQEASAALTGICAVPLEHTGPQVRWRTSGMRRLHYPCLWRSNFLTGPHRDAAGRAEKNWCRRPPSLVEGHPPSPPSPIEHGYPVLAP